MGRGKPFYGWYIVAACMLIVGASIGLFHNSFTVFVVPVSESIGLSRGALTIYVTVSAIAGMLITPFYGHIFEKIGLRRVMLTTSLVCCGVQFGFSFSSQLWQFYALAFLHGFCVVGIDALAIGILINNWFIEKRGFATGIAFTGSGVVAGFSAPLLTQVIAHFGWQMGYRTVGLMALVLLLPVILLVLREKPSDIGLLPLGAEADGSLSEENARIAMAGLTRTEAVKTPMFWLFMLATLLTSAITVGMAMQGNAYLTDLGYTAFFAGMIVSIYMFVTVPAKLVLGALFDRLGYVAGASFTGIVCLLASVLLLFCDLPGLSVGFAVTFGFAYATQTVSMTLLCGYLFGSKDFSNIYALVMVPYMVGAAIGSPLPAFIFDSFGSYRPAWMLCLFLAAVATGCYVMAVLLKKKHVSR